MTPEIFETEIYNQKISMNLHPEGECLSDYIRWKKVYSRNDLEILKNFISPGDVVVDIGANIGWYTMALAMQVGPKGKVYAFEPEPQNLSLLRRNLDLNGLKNIEITEACLSDLEGTGLIYKSLTNFGDHRLDVAGLQRNTRKTIEVKTHTFDSFFRSQWAHIKFLKIDVQGSEPRIFGGMKSFLIKNRPPMMVEYAPHHIYSCGSSPFEFFAFIEKYHYTPFLISSDELSNLKGCLEFTSINKLLEITQEIKNKDEGLDFLLLQEVHLPLLDGLFLKSN